MQKRTQKYLTILLYFFTLTAGAQNLSSVLKEADSLYGRKKYSEAFLKYQEIFDKGRFTPKMLLKMAYVKEGLGQIPEALYFLNIYYVNYPSQPILKKMERLAESKTIQGYEYNDINYFLFLYRRYKNEIIISLVGILFLFFLGILSNRVIFKRIPVASPYFFFFMAFFVWVFVNFSDRIAYKGIVMQDKALVMDSPSAAAKVLDVIPKGTRMQVWNDTDIWYQIRWNGHNAYVRKNNVKVPLAYGQEFENNFWEGIVSN